MEKWLLINFCPFSEKEQLFPGVPDFSLLSHWPGLGHMTIPHYKEDWKREDLISFSLYPEGKQRGKKLMVIW